MSWYSTLPYMVACLGLLFIPGGLLAVALGVRSLSLVAVAPLLSITLVACTAVVAPYVGLGWSPWTVAAASLGASVVLGIAALVIKKASGRGERNSFSRPVPRLYVIPIVGFLAGSLSIGLMVRDAVGHPENISQTFDNVFHLNAIRYILDTGRASSLTVSAMISGDGPPLFYPAGWHDLASLLVQMTGAPISVAANILNICIAAVVWPLGCMLLTRLVAGPKPYAVAAAGVLSAGFTGFPILLLDFGVLYPNFLSISMLPAALSCVCLFLAVPGSPKVSPVVRFGLAPIVAAGLALAHPNGLMSLIALSVPLLLAVYVRYCVRRQAMRLGKRRSILMGVGLLVVLVLVAVMWFYVRPPADAAFWPPVQTVGQAVGEIFTNSAMRHPPAWTVSGLMILGLVLALRSKDRLWFVGCFVIIAALFVVVSAAPKNTFRNALTGVWYNDPYRLAALLPMVALPLAAIGLEWIFRQLLDLWRSLQTKHSRGLQMKGSPAFGAVALPVVLLVAVLVTQNLALGTTVAAAHSSYSSTPDSPLLNSDKLKVIDVVDQFVPPTATIAVNPWNGSAMAFALADRNTTSKHTLSTYTPTDALLNDKLKDAATDPSVCPAARSEGVGYVLNFGAKEVHGGDHGFKGLLVTTSTPGFQLLAQVGDAQLYRLTACG